MNLKEMADNLGLEEEEYLELLALFVKSGISDLEKLQAAIEKGNTEEAINSAHSLKGAAGNLGLADFYESAKKTEMDARGGNLEKVVASIQTLREDLEKISRLV